MKVMITGVAGFIGSTLALRLLARGDSVYGVDNMNDYYDVTLKEARLKLFSGHKNFTFDKLDIADRAGMQKMFKREKFDAVMNLAAQAGVRYSIENPHAYIDANVVGFLQRAGGCRHSGVKHLVFARPVRCTAPTPTCRFPSTTTWITRCRCMPPPRRPTSSWRTAMRISTSCRAPGCAFFTVYGPWGRPDMALFKFTKGILEGTPIRCSTKARWCATSPISMTSSRGVVRVIDNTAAPDPKWSGNKPDPATSYAPFRIYNIGNNNPVQLMRYIEVLEQCLGKKAKLDLLPMQDGDVPHIRQHRVTRTGRRFPPGHDRGDRYRRFVEWYRQYYKVA